ncbi:hypothetical protein [Ramlibacter tataouinensis]|uniref:Uncharacterized protein n=1 Tax=Ramlibacter tataouinensis (strain ATCC BAA-407 / DSM 14655 / LMG 21543 / TTB310) TaxID=365046 RepID=F5Y0K8_RAMTT|nr:hypothetical protein [Ramlibacter tataouinensis]AEG93414.1 Hypothetical protein Rta_23160 [Ramlibacter tataouinensis TTB310]
MRKLPRAIPELDGGLFVPRQVAELLETVLTDYEQGLGGQPGSGEARLVLSELRDLLRMTGSRPALAPAREQLALPDPQQELIGRNLLRGG